MVFLIPTHIYLSKNTTHSEIMSRVKKRTRDPPALAPTPLTLGTWNLGSALCTPSKTQVVSDTLALRLVDLCAVQEGKWNPCALPPAGYTSEINEDPPHTGFLIRESWASDVVVRHLDARHTAAHIKSKNITAISIYAFANTKHSVDERAKLWEATSDHLYLLRKTYPDTSIVILTDANAHISLDSLRTSNHTVTTLGDEHLYTAATDTNGIGLLQVARDHDLAITNMRLRNSFKNRVTFSGNGVTEQHPTIIDWTLIPEEQVHCHIGNFVTRTSASPHGLLVIKLLPTMANKPLHTTRGRKEHPVLPDTDITDATSVLLREITDAIVMKRTVRDVPLHTHAPKLRLQDDTMTAVRERGLARKDASPGHEERIRSCETNVRRLIARDKAAAKDEWAQKVLEKTAIDGWPSIWKELKRAQRSKGAQATTTRTEKTKIEESLVEAIAPKHPPPTASMPDGLPVRPIPRPPPPTEWCTLYVDGSYREGRIGYGIYNATTGEAFVGNSTKPGGHEYLLDPAYAETLAVVVAVGIHSERLPPHVGIRVVSDKLKTRTRLAAAMMLGANAIPDLPHAELWEPTAAIAQHRHVEVLMYQKADAAHLRRAHKLSRLGSMKSMPLDSLWQVQTPDCDAWYEDTFKRNEEGLRDITATRKVLQFPEAISNGPPMMS